MSHGALSQYKQIVVKGSFIQLYSSEQRRHNRIKLSPFKKINSWIDLNVFGFKASALFTFYVEANYMNIPSTQVSIAKAKHHWPMKFYPPSVCPAPSSWPQTNPHFCQRESIPRRAQEGWGGVRPSSFLAWGASQVPEESCRQQCLRLKVQQAAGSTG